MSRESQDTLRAELQDAIAKVRHQIDVQENADHYIGSGPIVVRAVHELEAELIQLEEALARLGPHHPG